MPRLYSEQRQWNRLYPDTMGATPIDVLTWLKNDGSLVFYYFDPGFDQIEDRELVEILPDGSVGTTDVANSRGFVFDEPTVMSFKSVGAFLIQELEANIDNGLLDEEEARQSWLEWLRDVIAASVR